ncbi:MAG TPA: undecaprenyldiphospho-muramoylpentapeptide beta-N-acetylglucosaminyltransferase [Thermoanaerobaculia bacterium]|nr:undecaprenyldiphospho-muramoylpentapeptide beta-N-acetylglucosaminyltransferase [Thermoanaerobaculia bacterium]
MKTLMIAGGGTGGHIYPAIAIARGWLERDPANRRVVFVGTERGLEKTIVPKAGFPLEFIDVGGLKGKGGVDLIRNVLRLPRGFFQAFGLVKKHAPNLVLGVGGYSSGPVITAAKLRGVPTLIHESNAFPGLANRVVARFVTGVAVAFAEAAARMKRKDAVVTGNPIRGEFFGQAGLPVLHRVLVFGGSQGSRILNNTMTAALAFLRPPLDIVHQTGPNDLANVREAYRTSSFADARVVPYLDPMAGELAAAQLVICRAGAMTLGELAAVGRPAVLVPFALATNNHQEINARAVERVGGAVVITENELTPERLAQTITELMANPERLAQMSAAAKTMATPDATKNIVDFIETIQAD